MRTYIRDQVPVLFMRLDRHGFIREMNRFAMARVGMVHEYRFRDVIVDFYNTFSLEALLAGPETPHSFTLKAETGDTQTYQFHFYPEDDDILVFGHLDFDEIQALSEELLSVNQELNNLTRQLNLKNRDLNRALTKIETISRTDSLTGLANRRYFNERIAELISRADRKSLPVSLIMTDIDKFKRVNDTFGHDVGDRVLEGYARLMQENTRSEDLVARFGGEEFIILLDLTDTKEALHFAERIRTTLSRTDLMDNGEFITASFGVSRYIRGEGRDAFIKRADTALYEAKTTGRNRSVIAPHAPLL